MAGDRKDLQIIDQVFEYPTNGVDNWGKEGTDWACAVTEALARIIGPQDILITEIPIIEGQTDALINGLNFDTSIIQAVIVEGFIQRNFTDASGKIPEVDRFIMQGSYNGSDFFPSVEYTGNDAGVSLDILASGQGVYTSEVRDDTESILLKFEARAIIDDSDND